MAGTAHPAAALTPDANADSAQTELVVGGQYPGGSLFVLLSSLFVL